MSHIPEKRQDRDNGLESNRMYRNTKKQPSGIPAGGQVTKKRKLEDQKDPSLSM